MSETALAPCTLRRARRLVINSAATSHRPSRSQSVSSASQPATKGTQHACASLPKPRRALPPNKDCQLPGVLCTSTGSISPPFGRNPAPWVSSPITAHVRIDASVTRSSSSHLNHPWPLPSCTCTISWPLEKVPRQFLHAKSDVRGEKQNISWRSDSVHIHVRICSQSPPCVSCPRSTGVFRSRTPRRRT